MSKTKKRKKKNIKIISKNRYHVPQKHNLLKYFFLFISQQNKYRDKWIIQLSIKNLVIK